MLKVSSVSNIHQTIKTKYTNCAANKAVPSEQNGYKINFEGKDLICTNTNPDLFQKLMNMFGFFGAGSLIIHELKNKQAPTDSKDK